MQLTTNLETHVNHPTPFVTVDAVLLTLKGDALHVALHKRTKAPEAGKLALPGGHVFTNQDASVEETVRRVLQEKTGFNPRYLEQLQVFSGPDRDPALGWSVSVAFLALVPLCELEAAAKKVFQFYAVDHLPELAFDHADIIRAAVTRLRNKASYSTLPCALLPEEFTIAQMQAVYEAVLQTKINRANFRQKVEANDALVPTGGQASSSGRPAHLYRLKDFTIFSRVL